jgi:hypothetical protein
MPGIVGNCKVDVKLFGPFHEYAVPELLAVKLSVCPAQTGLAGAAVTVGVEGALVIETVFVSVAEHEPIVAVAVNAVVAVGLTVMLDAVLPWLHK